MQLAPPISSDLVLVGGGHAHVQLIRRWMMRPLPGVRLTVVLDRAEAVYSGMVPGYVAGDYAAPELEIDVVPLARRARARVIQAAATQIDPVAKRIALEGRPSIAYDVASLDVGSTVRGLELPGVREHALATRPIRHFVDRLDARLAAAAADGAPLRLVVVGAGAAGVELAFTLEARLRAQAVAAEITLLGDVPELLPGAGERLRARAVAEAQRRGIRLRLDVHVETVEKASLRLAGGESLACDLAVWATGAAPLPVIAESPLPHDEAGFVRVGETLAVVGHEDLFAVGDCARLDAHPWVPKAGVYAVRQGPLLDRNLRARLRGRALHRYRPQSDFLTLLNLGQRRALGAKWGYAASGRAVFWLKDWIDRRFMRRFQVLGADGAPCRHFPTPEAMGMEPMACGGCAAKVDAQALERALARLEPAPPDASVRLGLAQADDAAAIELPRGDLLVTSTDGFRAFADDPWLVGRVAAVNAVADVQAKGARPQHALALVTVPDEAPARAEETLYQALAGVRAALDPLGVSLVGGHSTTGPELFVALTVGGVADHERALMPLSGGRPGDWLLLTRPLGSGVVLAADMRGLARGAWVEAAVAHMLDPSDRAADVARRSGARAATDVSGFGFAGHLLELLRASDCSARIALEALPVLPGALALLARGERSSFHAANAAAGAAVRAPAQVDRERLELLFDPQTAGGLLLAITPERAEATLRALREAGETQAAVIGELAAAAGEPLLEIVPAEAT